MWMLLFACGPVETTFPAGLEPLEANTAPLPEGDDPYPEVLTLVSREQEDGVWTHARGYITASVADVWQTLQIPDVCVDRQHVSSYSITTDTDPAYEVSFRVHNVVDDIVTIEFDNDWRQGQVSGDVGAPEIVGVRWQKTEGTPFISVLEGSLVVTEIEDEVSLLEYVEHLDAAQTSAEDTEAFLQDFYDSARIVTHGGALPTYGAE
jgi:hypothetical protein